MVTNLCQVSIDVKYARDQRLGLKKNLQVVKKIIFTTKKMIYLTIVSELVVLCGFVHIY